MHGQISQYTSIQHYICFLQAIDQSAIGQAVGTGLRIDARNPECAELTLSLSAVTISVLPCLGDCLLGYSKHT